jgi:hypothetical protein
MNKKTTIRLTEGKLKSIITEAVKTILRENQEAEFAKDCEALYTAFSDVTGGEELRGELFNMGDLEFTGDDDVITVWKYDRGIMTSLLRDVANYDLIDIFSEPGTINIENSNHPDIAEIMAKYCDSEMIERVRSTFEF